MRQCKNCKKITHYIIKIPRQKSTDENEWTFQKYVCCKG